jgi:hypothetical protein
MPEKIKRGTVWQADELDLIVSDYFDMLAADLSGSAYVKSRHSAALMAKIDRSHRSVEFKHQNISAVLDRLGMPWIPGYKPKWNFQNAIFDAIDRYLTQNPHSAELPSSPQPVQGPVDAIFVSAPNPHKDDNDVPKRLRQLVAKFDPVERDRRNKTLGEAGERFVVDFEQRRLTEAKRTDLAKKVRWIANEDGDGAGYDILSYNLSGIERLLEVKTTNGYARTPFFLSRNEYAMASECQEVWRIYRVHQFASSPHIFKIRPPLCDAVNLAPETWRAYF